MTDIILANIFGGLVLFSVLMFVLFDGMTLGVGLLFPFIKKDNRGLAMATLHPFWDVNETWIIMAAIFLVTGFTRAYGIIIEECYIPVVILTGAISMRICALEFRHKEKDHIQYWEKGFFISSLIMSLIFGLFIGNMAIGFNFAVKNTFFNFLHLIRVLPILTGILTVLSFALIGASWLILKTNGELQNDIKDKGRFIIKALFVVSILSIGAMVFFCRNINGHYIRIASISLLILLYFLALFSARNCIDRGRDFGVLISSYASILFGSLILLCVTYPYIVPYNYTIYDLLRFKVSVLGYRNILILLFISISFVLLYFFKNYRVFKGKITQEFHY